MKSHTAFTRFALALFIAFATGGRLYAQNEYDWGDAPDPTYPTLAASGGANHLYVPSIFMGFFVDPEPNGQPSINANGDDNDILYSSWGDDEDGVSFPPALIPGQSAQITVTASVNGGLLDAWIDFNADGDWYDTGEQIYASKALSMGANILNFNVPASATLGHTYARFRFNASGAVLQPVGTAPDGEVEDYWIAIEEEQGADELDWGDAPDQPYPTLAANNGANHIINPALFLGFGVDGEPDGQPDINALGDDADILYPPPNDDEDGVVFTSLLAQGQPATLTVTASQPGFLDAWIDFNGNGTWELGEQVFASTPLSAGANPLSINLPASAAVGQTYARFRFSLNGGLAPTGQAPDGEVEDYELWIEPEQVDEHKMHYPQYPDPDGWDVRACNADDELQKVLADDFLCTSSGWITNITFWGSWFDDFWEEAPFQGIINIHLSLHTDIPDPDENGPEYSRPGELLWEIDFDPAFWPPEQIKITEEPESWQGFYDPNSGQWATSNHVQYLRYEIGFQPEETIYQTNGTIYWLDISVETLEGMWGWKTSRSPHFNDDAVWTDLPVLDPHQWNELRDPIYSNSLDLAFIINGAPGDPVNDWGDLPDSYNTKSGSSGANHTVVPGFLMGSLIDAEMDGQPTAAADGDDLNNQPDEDGVTFKTPFVAGQIVQFDVTVSTAGQLDIWMDTNGDGAWTLPSEHVFSAGVVAGLNPLSFPVPTSTPLGQNYIRYRFTSTPSAYAGGAPVPTGNATDGEVEDYAITVEELDWGDAPDPAYPTLAASGGANHLIAQGIFLGAAVDPEPDGQPDPQALGDDTNLLYPGVAYPPGDEDGVSLFPLIPGTIQLYAVFASSPALLNAWVDFNGNGSWLDPGEQIHTDTPLVSGSNSFGLLTPATAAPGQTFARFRYSTVAGLLPTGYASDGEVEDYVVDILEPQEIDWGDAPDAIQSPYYPTLMANNGAHHIIQPGMFLGKLVDPEPDGQPTPSSDGDDIDILYPSMGDDEDGVVLTSLLMPGGYATVDVTASQVGILDAWVDFGNDGSWAQPGDQIFAGQPLNAGTNSLIFPVPISAAQGNPAYSRFRYSIGGTPTYTGLAMEGEVEDHEFYIEEVEEGIDWGDAPDSYMTLSASGGPRHNILPGVMLGAIVDGEADGQPSTPADGDDTDLAGPSLGDDEDGVTFLGKLVAGSNATINVVAGVSGGNLDAWIDYNISGTFNSGEHLFSGVSLWLNGGSTNIVVAVPVPPQLKLGPSYARFRISTAGSLGPGGIATDGEVEDYAVDLYQPSPTNLVITNLTFDVSNTVATVEWTSQNNILYQMQASTNLLTNVWVDVEATVLGPSNWQTNNMAAESNKFYRISVPGTP